MKNTKLHYYIRKPPRYRFMMSLFRSPSPSFEVELHYELAMQYFASLELHIPSAKAHQDRLPL